MSTRRCGVLSGGERTRLAVARMLLRPSNTLLLDEPTNHLDLDSKEVLLDALVDYGGTLIFVSHDRYFVERLATKIIEIGNGTAIVYPGHLQGVPVAQGARGQERGTAGRQQAQAQDGQGQAQRRRRARSDPPNAKARRQRPVPQPSVRTSRRRRRRRTTTRRNASTPRRARSRSARRRAAGAHRRRSKRASPTPKRRSATSKQQMSAPGFYEDRAAAQPVIDRHQALMWQVGDLMHQWEELQSAHRPPTEA